MPAVTKLPSMPKAVIPTFAPVDILSFVFLILFAAEISTVSGGYDSDCVACAGSELDSTFPRNAGTLEI